MSATTVTILHNYSVNIIKGLIDLMHHVFLNVFLKVISPVIVHKFLLRFVFLKEHTKT